MSEEKQQGEATPKKDSGERDADKDLSPIDRAYAAAERMEAANKRREELLYREEELEAKRMLAGRSAGAPQQVEEKPESPAEYKRRILSNQLKDGEGRI